MLLTNHSKPLQYISFQEILQKGIQTIHYKIQYMYMYTHCRPTQFKCFKDYCHKLDKSETCACKHNEMFIVNLLEQSLMI